MRNKMIAPGQRSFALLLVVVNILFNYFQSSFAENGSSIKDVSDRYSNLFTPAPYAFAIWGIIYLAILIYAIVQVLPAQRNAKAYTELSFPIAIISILSMCWILSFTNKILLISEIIIVAMLGTSIYALTTARNFMIRGELGKWAVVPFSLYAGWISVATIANTSAWLVSEGFQGGRLSPETWTEIMLLVAVVIGVVESFRFKDSIYPSVVAWGIVAIWVSLQSSKAVGLLALFGGILLVIVAAINVLRSILARHHPEGR